MNKNNLKTPKNLSRLGILGAISASVILALIGVWYVIGAAAQRAPTVQLTATSVAATAPFVTKVVTIPPSATTWPPTHTPSPIPTATANAPFELNIVHSNDTWGYTQPCG